MINPLMPNGYYKGNIDQIKICGAYICNASEVTSSFSLPFDETFSLYTFSSHNEQYFKFQIAVNMADNKILEVKMRRYRSDWQSGWKSISFV